MMNLIGQIGIVVMLGGIAWIVVDASRRVRANARQEERERNATKWAIEREIQKANDVAEGLYKTY